VPASTSRSSNIPARRAGEPFQRLMAFQSERAQTYYDLAYAKLAPEDRASQRAGLIMAAICRATLREVERDGFRVLTHRISLTPLRKFWLAWKIWVST